MQTGRWASIHAGPSNGSSGARRPPCPRRAPHLPGHARLWGVTGRPAHCPGSACTRPPPAAREHGPRCVPTRHAALATEGSAVTPGLADLYGPGTLSVFGYTGMALVPSGVAHRLHSCRHRALILRPPGPLRDLWYAAAAEPWLVGALSAPVDSTLAVGRVVACSS